MIPQAEGSPSGRFDDGADGVVINEPDARRVGITSTMWDQYSQEHVDRGHSLPGAI